jgi:hypothetical protein
VRPKTKTNQPFDILQSGGLNHHNADLGIPLKGPDPKPLIGLAFAASKSASKFNTEYATTTIE